MAAKIQEMISFIEHHSLDERVYLKVHCLKQAKHTVEVMWERDAGDKPWRIRPANQVSWQYFTHSDLISQLEVEDVDLMAFEKGLSSSIVSQAIYADYYYRQAKKLLGDDTIEKASGKTEQFLSGLTDFINRKASLAQSGKSRLTSAVSSKRSVRHLSLIDPE